MLAAFGLVALDVALNSPGSAIAAAVSLPTLWLARWMDPRTPLIAAKPAAAAASSTAKPASSGYVQTGAGPVPISVITGLGGLFG